jgi:hypothetical protein
MQSTASTEVPPLLATDTLDLLRTLASCKCGSVAEGLQVFKQLEKALPVLVSCCFDNRRQDESTPLLISLVEETSQSVLVPLRFIGTALKAVGSNIMAGNLQRCPSRAFSLLHCMLINNESSKKLSQPDFQIAIESLPRKPLLAILVCALMAIKTSGDQQKRSVGKYLFRALLAAPLNSAGQEQARRQSLSLCCDLCLQRLQHKHRSLVRESVTFMGNLMLVDSRGKTVLTELKLLFLDVLSFDPAPLKSAEEQATYSKIVRLLAQLVEQTSSASAQLKLPYTLAGVLRDELLHWCNGSSQAGVHGNAIGTTVPQPKERERAVRVVCNVFKGHSTVTWALVEHCFGDSTASVRVAAVDRIGHIVQTEHERPMHEMQRAEKQYRRREGKEDGKEDAKEKEGEKEEGGREQKRSAAVDASKTIDTQKRLQRCSQAWLKQLKQCAESCAKDTAVGVRIAGLELYALLIRASTTHMQLLVQLSTPSSIELQSEDTEYAGGRKRNFDLTRAETNAQTQAQTPEQAQAIKSVEGVARAGFSGLLGALRDQRHTVRLAALRKIEELSGDSDVLFVTPTSRRYHISLANKVAELVVSSTAKSKASVTANSCESFGLTGAAGGRKHALMAVSCAMRSRNGSTSNRTQHQYQHQYHQQQQQDEEWAEAVEDCTGTLNRDYLHRHAH